MDQADPEAEQDPSTRVFMKGQVPDLTVRHRVRWEVPAQATVPRESAAQADIQA